MRARIRDAAIDVVAASGLEALTARRVAEQAGVTAGSVINNFGSMAGLREACDEHVAMLIREAKMAAMSAGASLDIAAILRESGSGHLAGYLAAVLAEDSPAVSHLVDELVADAQDYVQAGVDAGMVQPSEDPRGRAVVLMLSGLGSLVMHRHLSRLLGVDLTDPAADPTSWVAFLGPTYELYAQGLFTPEFGTQATSAVAGLRAGGGQAAAATPTDTTTTNTGGPAGPGGRHD